MATNYLKFTALQANSEIALKPVGSPTTLHLECSNDGVHWDPFTASTAASYPVDSGGYLMIRAPEGQPNTAGCGQSSSIYHQFVLTGEFKVSGNLMCLYDKEGTTDTVTRYGFQSLFYDCTQISDVSELELPAANVYECGYQMLFMNCTFTVQPIFANPINCLCMSGSTFSQHFRRTFYQCANLREINIHFGHVFYNSITNFAVRCTSLTKASVICDSYQSGDNLPFLEAFYGCSSLNEVHASIPSSQWTGTSAKNWLYGVASTGTYYSYDPQFDESQLPSRSATTIPAGWTIAQIQPVTSNTLMLVKVGNPDPIELEFKIDSNPWQPMVVGTVYSIQSGSTFKVRAPKSHSNTKLATDASSYYKFETTGSLNLSGNITSLLHYKAPDSQSAAPYCFSKLFYQSAGIKDASNLRLNCTKYNGATSIYESMFEGSSITQPPSIAVPSDFFTMSCYKGMFKGCASLLTAAQPPTTIKSISSNSHQEMFMNCTSLTTACSLNTSPTEVGHYAYASMFEGCTALTAPPATVNVVSNGYQHTATRMFYGCSSLQTAPSLPATAVGGQSYMQMFMNCTSLAAAPALPAATIFTESYRQMFEGCSSLSSVPSLNVSTLGGTFAMESMFRLCTSLTDLSHLQLKPTAPTQTCYQKIFDGCSSLTKAPHIKLVSANQETCLWGAFRNCSSLIELKVEFASWTGSNNFTGWVSGVPASGDFYCPYDLNEEHGTNRIPTGWTVHKAAEPSVFTLTSLEDGSTVKVQAVGSAPSIQLEYKLDSNAWQTYTRGTDITVDEGSSVKFRAPAGRASQSWSSADSKYNQFVMTGAFDMSGRVGSLLTYDEAYQGQWNAVYMFRDCAALRDCSNATIDTKNNVANYGFASTFLNCTGMTKAPVLLDTSSGTHYSNLFRGCTNLNWVKTNLSKSRLSSTNSATWLMDVAATGTFISTDPSMTTVTRSVHTVPEGWTIEIAS